MNAPGRLEPDERNELLQVLARVVDSGWWILGPEVAGFEAELAQFVGTPGSVGVGNGTDALELALRAVGVRRDDRVAVVANAGGYASAAVVACGAVPWFVDVGPDLLLDASSIGEALDAGCMAVVVTHLYGIAADVAAITKVARRVGVTVIEDCAQAHGLYVGDRHVGTFGDAGAFSFYPTKNLGAIGDGGAVVSQDPVLLDRLRRLRQYGWSSRYVSVEPGRNSRLDEVQAAVLRWALPRLDRRNKRRAEICDQYRRAAPGLQWVPRSPRPNVHHLCVLRVADRDSVATALREAGVETAIHYPVPDHRQGWLAQGPTAGGPLPETERAAAEVLSVPCFPELSDAEVETVAAALARLPGAS